MLRHHVGTQRRFSYCSKPERLCPLSPKLSGPPEPRRSLTVTSLRPIAASSIFKDRPAIGIAPVSATLDRQGDGVCRRRRGLRRSKPTISVVVSSRKKKS